MIDLRPHAIALCALTTCWLGIGIAPASAEETCVARSIDAVGQCHRRDFTRKVVDREIRGAAQSSPAPPPIDPDLLATRLLRAHGQGQWYPISGGAEWILSATPAEVTPDSGTYRLAPRHDARPTLYLVSMLPGGRTDATPEVRILASRAAIVGDALTAIANIPCIDPEGQTEDSGDYPDLAGHFAWLRLSPKHRILVAEVSRSEGYAGGGGSFTAAVLLDQPGAELVPVGCVAVSRYQMFGGSWNADGTRQHPESQASWDLRVAGNGSNWPKLWLRATTISTTSTGLVWDAPSGRYHERKLPPVKVRRSRK